MLQRPLPTVPSGLPPPVLVPLFRPFLFALFLILSTSWFPILWSSLALNQDTPPDTLSLLVTITSTLGWFSLATSLFQFTLKMAFGTKSRSLQVADAQYAHGSMVPTSDPVSDPLGPSQIAIQPLPAGSPSKTGGTVQDPTPALRIRLPVSVDPGSSAPFSETKPHD